MTYSLSGLSIGSDYTIEPDLTTRQTAYTVSIEQSNTPILYIVATPYTSAAKVTMTDGAHNYKSWVPQNPPQADWTWKYPYLPSTGGTVVIAIAVIYDGVTKDYTLTINYTKTA